MTKYLLILLMLILTPLYACADVVTYEIKKGDELMLISKSLYGTYHKWQKILNANPTIEPNRLKIGFHLNPKRMKGGWITSSLKTKLQPLHLNLMMT